MTHVLAQTPSQTVGPYFAYGLTPQQYGYDHRSLFTPVLASPRAQGQAIEITGQVFDGNGQVINDAMIEIAHANAQGQAVTTYAQSKAGDFTGYGRCGTGTDTERHFLFRTIKPGAYPWGNHFNAWRPNHIHFSLLGDCLASRLVTQMYFPGDPLLELDPIYQGIPACARERLVSRFAIDATEPDFALGYEFDIVLRGDTQTPFETKR